MNIFGKIAEDRIQKAIEEGKFEHLSGRGKPLNLDENPYEPEEWRSSFRLLKQNHFTLPWIAVGLEIEHDREVAHLNLRAAFNRHPAGPLWEAARDEFAAQLAALNRRILEYNLRVPFAVFQKPHLKLEREIRTALAGGPNTLAE